MPEGHTGSGAHPGRGSGSLCIWRVTDGKPGHDNQSLGLAEALAARVETDMQTVPVLPALSALAGLVRGRSAAFDAYPDPDLILGAGHTTHLSLLAARRARGGRAVVLMSPSVPISWFDLCLAPEHDRPPESASVIVTRGALNRVRPGTQRDESAGLILLGGPSRHFVFDVELVLTRVGAIVSRDAELTWTLATSRRTPAGVDQRLRRETLPNLVVVPVDQTSPDWLRTRLAHASRVWVTEDSVSMVYEALSSGAAVGLITLEKKRPGRLSRGLETLVADGQLTPFDDWQRGAALTAPAAPLDEAARCAKLILERWPDLGRA